MLYEITYRGSGLGETYRNHAEARDIARKLGRGFSVRPIYWRF
jgi:hypothetical protein